jgi:hypothetical protein
MTLQQLKYMIIAAEKGSITEAAKELYFTAKPFRSDQRGRKRGKGYDF